MKLLRQEDRVVHLPFRRTRLVFPFPLTADQIKAGEFNERCQAELALMWRENAERKLRGETA
jgi:hypothetical protein